MAEIRQATPGDAAAMLQVHLAAVHETAAAHYPAEVLDDWSPGADASRVDLFRQAIARGAETFLVAEDATGIVGFGSLAPATWEVRAVYVHPRAGRRGVGAGILAGLEDLARARRAAHLTLDASLNAEAFYRARGYHAVECRACRLAAWRAMPCVRMVKRLTGAPPS